MDTTKPITLLSVGCFEENSDTVFSVLLEVELWLHNVLKTDVNELTIVFDYEWYALYAEKWVVVLLDNNIVVVIYYDIGWDLDVMLQEKKSKDVK